MKKIVNSKAFPQKAIMNANQCVTPTNCSCTCRKCVESTLKVNHEIKDVYIKKQQ